MYPYCALCVFAGANWGWHGRRITVGSRSFSFEQVAVPRPPNVPLLRALRSLLDGTWGILKGSWGVLVS